MKGGTAAMVLRSVFPSILAAIALTLPAYLRAEDSIPRPLSHESSEVTFRPGDAVRVTAYPDTAAVPSGMYHVNSEGCIHLPIMGIVKVAGMTPAGLRDYIKLHYVEYLRNPNATMVRPLIRVAATGGFHSPGLWYVDPDLSLWDVVRLAGGPVRDDGMKLVRWTRGDSTVARSALRYLACGESLEKIGFRSGDELVAVSRPKRSAGEIVTGFVFPSLSISFTIALTGITAYQLIRNGR